MSESRLFWIPDYYERFLCKADRCRTNCCHGWSVTISQQDYFNLLSVPCSPRLRQKLDTALHLLPDADSQRFAQISHDWLGNCPLQRKDGLCALQMECGEGILSSTCRYYPRGIRTEFVDECCCSSSCEGVLETMFASHEPIHMVQKEMTFDLPLPPRAEGEADARAARQIQSEWIAILQDRRFPLRMRLQRLGCAAHALHREEKEPHLQMERALSAFKAIQTLDFIPAFAALRDLLFLMKEHSKNLRPFADETIAALHIPESGDAGLKDAYAQYKEATVHLTYTLPNWEIYFEHMLVNHVLYQGYPYSTRHESVWDEYMALCALYTALSILTAGYMATHDTLSDFVDVCAAAFKLFEHANFDHNAMVLFHRLNMTDIQSMAGFTLL